MTNMLTMILFLMLIGAAVPQRGGRSVGDMPSGVVGLILIILALVDAL